MLFQYCTFAFWDKRPTVGFSGSGGAGKTPSPKNYFAGSRRIPSAAKPLSAANGVSPPALF